MVAHGPPVDLVATFALPLPVAAALARTELQEGWRALLTRLPGLRVAGEIAWKIDMPVRGPRRMPIGW
jgi:cytochrome P450